MNFNAEVISFHIGQCKSILEMDPRPSCNHPCTVTFNDATAERLNLEKEKIEEQIKKIPSHRIINESGCFGGNGGRFNVKEPDLLHKFLSKQFKKNTSDN